MSLVERLYRIARAQLGGRSRSADANVEDDAAPTEASSPPPPPPPREDSELATAYANLEIPYGADLETVRKSWKRLVRRYHPDFHGDDAERQRTATELVKGLNRAYETIRRHREG